MQSHENDPEKPQITPSGDPFILAQGLTEGIDTEAIRLVLSTGLHANLDRLDQHKLFKVIAARTGVGIRVLAHSWDALNQLPAAATNDGQIALAQRILAEHYAGGEHLIHAPDGVFYAFGGRRWAEVHEQAIGKLALDLILAEPGAFGAGHANNVIRGALGALRYMRNVEVHPFGLDAAGAPVLCLQNCELHFKEGEWEQRPHAAATMQTHEFPFAFDATATCPEFDGALEKIFAHAKDPTGMIRHVLEIIGYIVQPTRPLPLVVALYGSGANGKSSLLSVIKAILGSDLVFANSVELLGRDRFVSAELAGRRAYIDDDVKMSARLDDGLLKTIAQDQVLTARRAYGRRAFSFRVTATPILAMNSVPHIADVSHGFLRRLQVIPFDRRFEPDEQDHQLFERIIKNELPGVLNRVLAGFLRLYVRQDFDPPVDCLEARRRFQEEASPLAAFVREAFHPDPGGRVKLPAVYQALQAWCGTTGAKVPATRNQLKSRLEAMDFQIHKSNGVMCVRDVRLGTPA